ncbi:4-phosphoerythronate dehydrogenase [Saccharospirillum salsuginis]|uniref:Erythronate-4-phosphate dehydrogenase n=1 Tax=Saccharospirillum salsuginis TaxID=418750 RepID=A0A918KG21_9GAMM|nr:4-phosphoerythronate dehydrogenase [Saccharospirillum salsuginis]GGX62454.1 erythronate-4-phosphate dehydrogenase [Saccharospirillum salsuginis]
MSAVSGLRIVADENMPHVEPWFSGLAHSLTRKPGRTLTRDDLMDADVLLVRSVTQVNADLLTGTPVRFVGSATIGTDHIDQAWLAEQGIAFHHAPGCNAQSVVDWVLSVFARLHLDFELPWWQRTIGVIGAGNVGGKLVDRLKTLGVRTLVCDPPRAEREEREGTLGQDDFVGLNTLLQASDIVCMHAPLTRPGEAGQHATEGLIGADQLALMKPGAWLINAGRGPVIQEGPLQSALDTQCIHAVLDVWPDEPRVSERLLNAVYQASPHVAGYSQEGKWTGTRMLAEALHHWANQPLPSGPDLPQGPTLNAAFFSQDTPEHLGSELVQALHDPARDTVAMQQSVQGDHIPPHTFDALRKEYPKRRELAAAEVSNVPAEAEDWLRKLGFRL